MAKPIRFRTKKEFKIVNRCIMCGKVISMSSAICRECEGKRQRVLKKFLRSRK